MNGLLLLTNPGMTDSGPKFVNRCEELERRLREAEEASARKTLMLASLSHDIRSPLQAITAMAELIHRAAEIPGLPTRIPELAQRLKANVLSMVDMLSEVIDTSTFESGRISVNTSEFPLAELLDEECQRLLPLAHAKKLELVVEPSGIPLRLRTDRTKLSRIVGNLVGNAIKFTSAGVVTLAARLSPQGEVLISVKDTGTGIDPQNLKRIFEEFAQFQDFQRGPSGWGLGLPICRRLVQLIGGEISVESRLHEGSVFTVRLPESAHCRAR